LASIIVTSYAAAGVTLEGARLRELAELVPDHVLVDQHRHMGLAVMNRDRQPDHFGQDHRTPRPGLDRTLGVRRRCHLDLLEQMQVDERAFLE
jgi:hypothetical protein